MTESILETGIVAYQQGERQKAIGVFSRMLKQDPNNADAWFWMGRSLEDAEKAKFCFERAAYLNQQLKTRDYIYVDPDDIPKPDLDNFGTLETKAVQKPEPQPVFQPRKEPPRISTEINPFMAAPLPEGFTLPRSKRNLLEWGLYGLLGVLILVVLYIVIMGLL